MAKSDIIMMSEACRHVEVHERPERHMAWRWNVEARITESNDKASVVLQIR